MSETENTTTETVEQNLQLSLTVQDVNTVLACLNEAPFKIADPIIKKIVADAQQQLTPSAA